MMKAIAIFAMLGVGSALAADAPNVPPVAFEPQPACTGDACDQVTLLVQDQCVWASNKVAKSPVSMVLGLSNGASAQFTLKSAQSHTAANAPYDNPSCDTLETRVQIANRAPDRHAAEALAADPVLVQQLKTCNAEERAAREANLKKDEYYDSGSFELNKPLPNIMGGYSMRRITQAYSIYNLRLKIGATCLGALHDIKSYTANTTQTIGSWAVSAADGFAYAVLTPSAITAGNPSSNEAGTLQLQLRYGIPGTMYHEADFTGSGISFGRSIMPSDMASIVFHVLADGKDVGQFSGGGVDLRKMFGADLAGLTSVKQISVISNGAPTGSTTYFAANLQQTAAALAAMKVLGDAM